MRRSNQKSGEQTMGASALHVADNHDRNLHGAEQSGSSTDFLARQLARSSFCATVVLEGSFSDDPAVRDEMVQRVARRLTGRAAVVAASHERLAASFAVVGADEEFIGKTATWLETEFGHEGAPADVQVVDGDALLAEYEAGPAGPGLQIVR
ncbi:MAG: hypothetical protein QM774_00205 [Gordonia sp. (in: high G+C Gram-positive bacteria)]|uniref:hypothetical protein n=1 Tax=Gordonia sp. (in: high G+C Gram-positive bacteria) TaxID=84139 RepID=UPI0039E636CD